MGVELGEIGIPYVGDNTTGRPAKYMASIIMVFPSFYAVNPITPVAGGGQGQFSGEILPA